MYLLVCGSRVSRSEVHMLLKGHSFGRVTLIQLCY